MKQAGGGLLEKKVDNIHWISLDITFSFFSSFFSLPAFSFNFELFDVPHPPEYWFRKTSEKEVEADLPFVIFSFVYLIAASFCNAMPPASL